MTKQDLVTILAAILEDEIEGEKGAADSYPSHTLDAMYHEGFSDGLQRALSILKDIP